MPQPDPTARKGINQRRSQRLLLRVQIVAERRAGQADTKSEATETLAVNAHGALILLSPPVEDIEQILIKNPRTSEEQMCRVVHQGLTEGGRLHVGVEFLTPSPNFWRVSFPPEDWATSIRDARPAAKE
ncbi:MAG TPA: hypothetical protein VIH72_06615 [Candidatus Acidoferrales bacterium]|jgi:hypothetical protein